MERLKLEVADLQKEVAAVKAGSGGDKPKVDPVQLETDVAELQKQVHTAHMYIKWIICLNQTYIRTCVGTYIHSIMCICTYEDLNMF